MSPVSKTHGRPKRMGLASRMAAVLWATWLIATSTANMSGPVPQQALSAALTGCVQLMINPSFETSEAWIITDTTYRAAYSTDYAHTGVRSMRTGIPPSSPNVRSYSSVRQAIAIPADAVSATLHLWYLPLSQEADPAPESQSLPHLGYKPDSQPLSSDRQYVLILNEQNRILDWLMWSRSSRAHWSEVEYDLNQYIGQTIASHIGTYNDGQDGVTTMYVDDVSLQVCFPSGVRRHWLPLILTRLQPASEPTMSPSPSSTPNSP